MLAELGAPALVVPEAAGGLGLSDVDLVGVLEEAGRACLPEPLLETAALAAPDAGRPAARAGPRRPPSPPSCEDDVMASPWAAST